MKKIFFLLSSILLLTSCMDSPSTVTLSGQLEDMGSSSVVMRYNGAASLLGDSRDIIIETDDDGNFRIEFPLEQPSYYSISRNTLYLTPGDEMTVYINQNNQEARFEGRGAEVNLYLRGRLFPKGGSFLEAGKNVQQDFEQTMKQIEKLAAERRSELEALTEASPLFRQLEKARIDADIVNSVFSYPDYADLTAGMNREEAQRIYAEFLQNISPLVNPLIHEFSADAHLDVAVVRDVFYYENQPGYEVLFHGIPASERRNDLLTVYNYVQQLRRKVTEESVESVRQFARSLEFSDFRDELELKVNQAASLLPGNPAFDLELERPDGRKLRLSDLQGKMMYLDFWATWCGPCKQESPYFDALASKLKDEPIHFIKISSDQNKKTWLRYIEKGSFPVEQYNSTDLALVQQWCIHFIPRFILIDKDFRILDAYAPLPSDPGTEAVLRSLL